jgi:outer membrane lipoprotein SlyB
MKKIFLILSSLIMVTFVGCTKNVSSNKVTGNEKAAEEYVKARGYKITAYKGEIQKYIL